MVDSRDAERVIQAADQLRAQAAALLRASHVASDGVEDAAVGHLLIQASALETTAWELMFRQPRSITTTEELAG